MLFLIYILTSTTVQLTVIVFGARMGNYNQYMAYYYELEIELEKCFFHKNKYKQATSTQITHVERFMSGNPYEGAERTAGVRATQGFYSAWTDIMQVKREAPHWANIYRIIQK